MENVEELKLYFDQKFNNLEKKVTNQPQGKAPVVLNNKGNQRQYEHEEKVLALLGQVAEAIEDSEGNLAYEKTIEAKKEVQKRMKMIKLADRSEFGWNTVAEYESDELASNSDDEKKMKRAESRAQAKRKRRQIEFSAKRQKVFGEAPFQPSTSTTRPPFRFQTQGSCSSCGQFGHWRRNCPNAEKQ